eukprot:1160230-Pelagomonas_calceolata.AAC.6
MGSGSFIRPYRFQSQNLQCDDQVAKLSLHHTAVQLSRQLKGHYCLYSSGGVSTILQDSLHMTQGAQKARNS